MDPGKLDQMNGQQHWLNMYSLKVKTAVVVTSVWIGLFLLASFYGAGDFLDVTLADPVNFMVRERLGRGAVQSERLKVYAIDDRAFAAIKTPMPPMDTWAETLDAIVEKKPKVVIIDAMFSATSETLSDRGKKLFERIARSGIPIVTGAFVSEKEVENKHPLPSNLERYSAKTYLTYAGEDGGYEDFRREHQPHWNVRGTYAYGPSQEMASLFKSSGHFQLFGPNKIEPFQWLGGDRVIPHVALYAADSVQFVHRGLAVNGQRVALDNHGAIPVNFISRSKLKMFSMLPLIQDAKAGYSASKVEEGDVVLILPLYFTGNVDLRPSPFGWIPGGEYLVAMISSVLNGQWLQPVLAGEALIIVMSFAAAGLAFFGTPGIFWAGWGMTIVGVFVLSQLLFSFAGLVVPYLLPMLAGSIAGAHIFALKVRSSERKVLALRVALDGAVSPAQMDAILRSPEQVNLEPRERIVTLMFIDVVGFSLSSENMLPRLAFDNLKTILTQISEIVHEFGGVIDKTLGDGLLCYFGYRFDSDETDSDHPEKALRCAIKIQRKVLSESIAAARAGQPIYPLRIGINTSSCYLGNLGSGQRIEFTVVGNGVNYAKRLESACDMYQVMLGATTYDLVRGLDFEGDIFTRKMIRIKHHTELVDAYMADPAIHHEAERAEAIDAFRRSANLRRISDRMAVRDSGSVLVQSNLGSGVVLNFSPTGVSVMFKTSLSRGSVIDVSFESREPGLGDALTRAGIGKIEGEIRWSYLAAGGVAHGIMFRSLSSEQQSAFVRVMSEYAFLEANFARGGHDLDKIQSA